MINNYVFLYQSLILRQQYSDKIAKDSVMFEQGLVRCSRFANKAEQTFSPIQIKTEKLNTLGGVEIKYRQINPPTHLLFNQTIGYLV